MPSKEQFVCSCFLITIFLVASVIFLSRVFFLSLSVFSAVTRSVARLAQCIHSLSCPVHRAMCTRYFGCFQLQIQAFFVSFSVPRLKNMYTRTRECASMPFLFPHFIEHFFCMCWSSLFRLLSVFALFVSYLQ